MSKKKNKKKNTNKNKFTVLNGKPTKSTEIKTVKSTTETKKYSYFSNTKNYDYMGRMNKTDFPEFVELCKLKQMELKKILERKLLDAGYIDVVSGDGYVYAKGTVPVLLTAHMDTVHKEPVKDFYEYYDEEKKQHIISSPQGIGGDDRCGVYMILELIKTHKCSVLFCEDEEIGGIGSEKFCKTELINELSELKYLIELDRNGKNDAVFYDCENDDFTDFIEDNTNYQWDIGSFSDISNLSPDCKVASVNLSCGYHNAHTTSEYVIIEEMLNTIETVRKLLDVECEQFEYIEKVYTRSKGYDYTGYHSNYKWNGSDYELGYEDGYEEGYLTGWGEKGNDSNEYRSMSIMVYSDIKHDIIQYISNGRTEAEAFGNFFMKNPEYCYKDIYDYELYENKVCGDGWLGY